MTERSIVPPSAFDKAYNEALSVLDPGTKFVVYQIASESGDPETCWAASDSPTGREVTSHSLSARGVPVLLWVEYVVPEKERP